MDQEQFYSTLRSFFTERHPKVKPEEIGPRDNLWDLRVIDSFSTVELLAFLEERLGRRIPIAGYSPRVFHTMERIYETFVARVAEVAK